MYKRRGGYRRMIQGLIDLAERPWVSLVIGTAIGVFSILLSIILYRRGIVRNSLSFVKVEVEILTINNETWRTDLDIKYKGVEITRLTAGRVGIWNSGNTTINYEAVIQSQPLMVRVPDDAKLLVCQTYAMSRQVINARVESIDSNKAFVAFDYLDPGDGFMLHIAQSSPRNTLIVDGTIKGLPRGLTEFSIKGSFWIELARSSMLPGLIVGLGTIVGAKVARALNDSYGFKPGDWQYNTIGIGFFVLIIAFGAASIFAERLIQKRRSAYMPKQIRTDPVIASTMGLRIKR